MYAANAFILRTAFESRMYYRLVYDRNHLFGLGSDTETETENWPKLLADTETNQNSTIFEGVT